MKYYKTIDNGVVMIHGCDKLPASVPKEDELSYEKYEELHAKFLNAPENTFESVYYFDWETESYLPRERTEEEKVCWYVNIVLAGTITLEEVPTEYRTQVEAQMPVSEEEQWATDLMEEVSDYDYQ